MEVKCNECGEMNSQDAKYCKSCGTPLIAQSQSPVFMTPPVKKKSKAPAIVISVILVLLLGGGGVLFAATSFKRDFLQLVQGETQYARNIAKETITSNANAMLDLMGKQEYVDAVTGNSKASADMSLSMTVSEGARNKILAEMDPEYSSLVDMLLDSGLDMKSVVDQSGNNVDMSFDLAWKLKNTPILNLNMIVQNNAMYAKIGELYGKYIGVYLNDYGVDLGEVIAQSGNPFSSAGDFAKVMSDNREILKAMVDELADKSLAQITGISVRNNTSVSVNSDTIKLDEVVFTVTEEDFARTGATICRTINGNPEYLRVVRELVNSTGSVYFDSDAELATSLEDAAASADFGSYDLNSTVDISLYVDSGNKVDGVHLSGAGFDSGFVYDFSKGFEGWAYSGDVGGRVYGGLNGSISGFSGSLNIELRDYSGSTFGCKLAEFSGLNFDYKTGKLDQDIKITIPIGEIVTVMNEYDPYSSFSEAEDYLTGSVLNIEAGYKNSESSAKIEFASESEGISFILDMTSKTIKEADIQAPSDSEVTYFDMYSQPDIDIMEVVSNLQIVLNKIESMGYNVDMFYEMLGGVMGNY